MTFEEIVDQALAMLQRRGRVAYRTLKRQFQLDDEALEDLKTELIKAQRLAVDEDGEVLVWIGEAASPSVPAGEPTRARRASMPSHLAEKIRVCAILDEEKSDGLPRQSPRHNAHACRLPSSVIC